MFPEKFLHDIRASTAELWVNTGLLRITAINPGNGAQCTHGLMQHVRLLALNQTALTDSLFKSKFTCELTEQQRADRKQILKLTAGRRLFNNCSRL